MPKRRDQVAMTHDEMWSFIESQKTVQVATINRDGTPHLVPLWFAIVDGEIVLETFTKSQKVKNLERDPRLTLLFEAGDRYEELRGVTLYARAELVREVEALDQTLSRLAARAGDARRDAEAVDAGSHAADTFDRAGRDAADGAARAEAGRASLAGGRYEEARARMVEGQSLLAAAIDGFGKARDDAQARIEAERKAEEARRAAEEKRRADARRAARRRAEQEAAAKPAPAPPVEVAGVTAAGKPDIEVVGEMLAMFKTAYEHRDLDTMQEVSQITRDRRQFLEEIFRTYSTVEVKITGFNMVGDTATAVVSIERLQAPDGNIAIPSDQWRAAELTIHKAGGRWRKIVW